MHHLNSWIETNLMSLAFLFHYLMLNMFRMLIHPSSGACDLCVELFHGLYCSGTMCVGVTVWFGWGGLLSGCWLKDGCITSEICWTLNNEIKRASDIKLVYLYSTNITQFWLRTLLSKFLTLPIVQCSPVSYWVWNVCCIFLYNISSTLATNKIRPFKLRNEAHDLILEIRKKTYIIFDK